MQYELNYETADFQSQLNSRMVSSSTIRVHGWSRAKTQELVLRLIKQHNYAVQSYSTLNYAELTPRTAPVPASQAGPTTDPGITAKQ